MRQSHCSRLHVVTTDLFTDHCATRLVRSELFSLAEAYPLLGSADLGLSFHQMAGEGRDSADSDSIVREREPGTLLPGEDWWRDHYDWLKESGYLLRQRYHPDWVPSWKGKDHRFILYEDGRSMRVSTLLIVKDRRNLTHV